MAGKTKSRRAAQAPEAEILKGAGRAEKGRSRPHAGGRRAPGRPKGEEKPPAQGMV